MTEEVGMEMEIPPRQSKRRKQEEKNAIVERKDRKTEVKIKKKEPIPEYDVSILAFQVVTVTVAEIRRAQKTKSVSESSKRQLIQCPNANERSKIYAETAQAIADREAAALPSHGGRNWTCNVVISDDAGALGDGVNVNNGSTEQGRSSSSASTAFESHSQISRAKKKGQKKNFGPLFRWYRGKLELACLPHLLEKIDILDDGVPSSLKQSIDPLVSFKKTDLQERQITSMSTWAWENPSYPAPNIKRRWLSPDHVIFNSRTAALQHAAELLRRDKLIDRVLFGFGSRGVELRPMKPTKKDSLEAGYFRFLRDGLWVVGQEEDWLEERLHKWNNKVASICMQAESAMDNATTSIHDDSLGTVAPNMMSRCNPYNDTQHEQDSAPKMTNDTPVTNVQPSRLADDEESGKSFTSSSQVMDTDDNPPSLVSNATTENETIHLGTTDINSEPIHDVEHYNNQDETMLQIVAVPAPDKSLTIDGVLNLVPKNESMLNPTSISACSTVPIVIEKAKRRRQKARAVMSIAPSNHWRLTPNQIDCCTDAINDHFQRVMYTIKVKQLQAELADGFDIIRERGRGRFDMQIPSFDDKKFDFLTDLETAKWMPVVRQILGNDATLVHKGCFLSLPGSDAQIYHQDGPHLTTKCQRSCHAVNVFIPLVDLHEKNGPTEFCLGTHILGYEYYAKEMLYTPTVKAGTPIIFDYRLGHRGLGNSTDIPRPIVYLTYTSASREFRDQINFSRKRYKKFGEILDLPLSREERARKRCLVDDKDNSQMPIILNEFYSAS